MLDLTTLALAIPPCPAAPAAPPKAWTGTFGLGVVAVTGNARNLTANLTAVRVSRPSRASTTAASS